MEELHAFCREFDNGLPDVRWIDGPAVLDHEATGPIRYRYSDLHCVRMELSWDIEVVRFFETPFRLV